MSTTLEPDFLLAVIRMAEFKREKLLGAKAGLLSLALREEDFTAADLPESLTEGSAHRAGAATGSLIAMGLLVVVDRVKSPKPSAKGRRVDVLRLAPGKRSTVLTWMRANGLPVPQAGQQMELVENS